MIKGVLFDMDGVLVDSEQYICNAAILMFRELGIVAKPSDFQPFVGMGENRYIGGVAELYGLEVDIEQVKARTYSLYKEIIKGKLLPLPGALEFMIKCRNKGLMLALATSADPVKMDANLNEIGLARNSFNTVITGHDVIKKKPFPDIYLKASESLGLKPSECLVVEDAVSGIESGIKAGCKCLAVTSSFDADALSRADWICSSLINVPEVVLDW